MWGVISIVFESIIRTRYHMVPCECTTESSDFRNVSIINLRSTIDHKPSVDKQLQKTRAKTWLCMQNYTIARPMKETTKMHAAWQCLGTATYTSSGSIHRQRLLAARSALERRYWNARHLLSTLKPNKRDTGGRQKGKNLRDEIIDTGANVLLSSRSSARDMPRT